MDRKANNSPTFTRHFLVLITVCFSRDIVPTASDSFRGCDNIDETLLRLVSWRKSIKSKSRQVRQSVSAF